MYDVLILQAAQLEALAKILGPDRIMELMKDPGGAANLQALTGSTLPGLQPVRSNSSNQLSSQLSSSPSEDLIEMDHPPSSASAYDRRSYPERNVDTTHARNTGEHRWRKASP